MQRTLRPGQKIPLGPLAVGSFVALVDGLAMIEGRLNGRPQVVSLVFPGDVVIPNTLPPLLGSSLTCLSRRTLVMHREADTTAAPMLEGLVSQQITYTAARAALQAVVLASLKSDERVATLLYEAALRTGKNEARGCTFNLPLSRSESAIYLGLNPDTVSRIMSGMRSSNVVTYKGRYAYVCPDLKRLADQSPVAEPLAALIVNKPTLIPMISEFIAAADSVAVRTSIEPSTGKSGARPLIYAGRAQR